MPIKLGKLFKNIFEMTCVTKWTHNFYKKVSWPSLLENKELLKEFMPLDVVILPQYVF